MSAFKMWCADHSLKDETVAVLLEQGFDSVKTLTVIENQDVLDLNIPHKAQLRLLQAAIKEAKNFGQVEQPPQTVTAQTVTNPPASAPLAMGGTGLGLTIDSLLGQLPQNSNSTEQSGGQFRPEYDPTFHLIAGKSSGNTKALEVLDFVGLSVKCDLEEEQVVSEIGENNSLILKTSQKKPKYENLTIWQWSLGAIRIQDELVRIGKLTTETHKRQYWGYMCKILELNTRFEWQSILEYDREYRRNQARFNFPWGTEIPHLSSVQLKDKKLGNFNGPKKTKFAYSNNQSNGNNAKKQTQPYSCRDFNRDKCSRASCKFKHVCSVQDCGKPHPAFKHESDSLNA